MKNELLKAKDKSVELALELKKPGTLGARLENEALLLYIHAGVAPLRTYSFVTGHREEGRMEYETKQQYGASLP